MSDQPTGGLAATKCRACGATRVWCDALDDGQCCGDCEHGRLSETPLSGQTEPHRLRLCGCGCGRPRDEVVTEVARHMSLNREQAEAIVPLGPLFPEGSALGDAAEQYTNGLPN